MYRSILELANNSIGEAIDSIFERNYLEEDSFAPLCPSQTSILTKRFIDLLLGSIILILIFPLLIILMIVIKLDSPGAVIFHQKRLGLNGSEFNCYKLRTMYENNQERLEKYFQDYPSRIEEWEKYAKLKGNDPRVTPCGRWLRRWSLDELPQIVNVLQGDMSLLGPRPYMSEERTKMGEFAEVILSTLPGITGLWQVSGRNEIDFDGRLQLEYFYVLNRSWRLDLFILFKTLPIVLIAKDSY